MRRRFYVDTSVWRGVYDPRVSFDSILFFNMVNKRSDICLYSKVVEKELRGAPKEAQKFLKIFWYDKKEKLNITSEVLRLARVYVDEGVVSNKSMNDCIHVAVATIYQVGMLVSWNFKHIVGKCKAKAYNDINVRLGYSKLNIYSPREVLEL